MNASFTLRWLVQAGLGVMLVILLTIHLIVNHWAAPHGLLTYADVVRYYDVPGIAWMEAAFLIVVTVHCLLGLHSILLDLNLSARITHIAAWLLTFVGLTTILYGIWLTRTIASR
jgi:succinate dehydrogenase hydrophobic anchor subunit